MNNLGHKLSISIVNFNTGDYLLKCLRSLKEVKDEVNFDIWIADNASSDDSFQKAKREFPNLNYIPNKENLGFGKAHNIVLKKLNSEYILILNPDTEIRKDVLKTMISYMESHKDVGAATCKLVLNDGSLDFAAHRGFPTPLASFLYFLGNNSLYHLSKKNLNVIHEVDSISGSFFLTRRSVLSKVGLFNEDYFMYAEDIDLCYRIKRAGYKIMYVPTVSILHHKGISSGLKRHSQYITTANLETKVRSLNAFYQTMKLFYKSHYAKKYPFFVNLLIYLGINIKWWLAKRKMMV